MSDCCKGRCHDHNSNNKERHTHENNHAHGGGSQLHRFGVEIVALILLVAGIIASHVGWFGAIAQIIGIGVDTAELLYFFVLCNIVSEDTIKDALKAWRSGDFFNEFTLMILAAIGAFIIGEFPEGAAVLLFYALGEKLEDSASQKAKNRIRSLLDKMPKKVEIILPDGSRSMLLPEDVKTGNMFAVKPGERVPLDGILTEKSAHFDTSAITGESVPAEIEAGAEVLSGSIPIDTEVRLTATREYSESSMSRLMKMIEEAAEKKSHTETMLRRITRWYTPLVISLAVLLFTIPWIVSLLGSYTFVWQTWLERSLVLLVCSCPCALVVSVPLSYFAAIGASSRIGLLFKGGKYLDQLRRADTLLLDKTGTLTTGSFHVAAVHPAFGSYANGILAIAAALDMESTHPLARAIVAEAKARNLEIPAAEEVTSIHGGMKGIVDGKKVVLGSRRLLASEGIDMPHESGEAMSEICVALDGSFSGAIYLEDTVKEDAAQTIEKLHRLGFTEIGILSGDRKEAVKRTAEAAGVDSWRATMLPDDKQKEIHTLISEMKRTVVYVGDGINDAPSLAAASVGIAIGTGGTDLAIDSADAVLTGHNLASIARGVEISQRVHRVVIQNVIAALGIKAIVMILGAVGIASLWAAVFADSGIMLLTVIWTLRSLRMK